MKARELIKRLQQLADQNMEIMILDGFNGGGTPREINLGPSPHMITAKDADEAADCEMLVGELVYVLGFGSY